jgi:hypothetical protein
MDSLSQPTPGRPSRKPIPHLALRECDGSPDRNAFVRWALQAAGPASVDSLMCRVWFRRARKAAARARPTASW